MHARRGGWGCRAGRGREGVEVARTCAWISSESYNYNSSTGYFISPYILFVCLINGIHKCIDSGCTDRRIGGASPARTHARPPSHPPLLPLSLRRQPAHHSTTIPSSCRHRPHPTNIRAADSQHTAPSRTQPHRRAAYSYTDEPHTAASQPTPGIPRRSRARKKSTAPSVSLHLAPFLVISLAQGPRGLLL